MVLLAGLVLSSAVAAAPVPGFELSACQAPGLPPGARCGRYEVFENRSARAGRRIGLNVVVLPAQGPDRLPDPMVFLAGGPGDGATRMAPGLTQEFAGVLAQRDAVLVDQRGTGKSHPLNCRLYGGPDDLQSYLGDFFPPEAIKTCRAALEADADLTQYTTAIAADDLDEVLAALGYARVNLWGGSYGTRAALVFLRRHGDRVRSATLLGVAPPEDPVPLRFAQDFQRALEGVLGECLSDATCRAAFPELSSELRALFDRLGKGPAPAEILHPGTGDPRTVSLSRDLVVEAIRYLMYGSGTASLVPAVIHQAAGGDLAPLAEFALFGRREIVGALGTGLYLSVTCAEDLPFIAPGEGERAAQGSLMGDYRLAQQRRACGLWPRAQVPASEIQPVVSQAPVLLMAGQWDPATPPALAQAAAKGLPKARQLVIPQGGHSYEGLQGTDCLRGLMTAFVERASVEGLDTACLAQVRRPPFATSLPPLKSIALPVADVARLAGQYRAEGAPFEVKIEAVGDRLRIQLPGEQEYLLVPVAADRFRLPGALGLYLVFSFEGGRVTSVSLEESGEATLVLKPAPGRH